MKGSKKGGKSMKYIVIVAILGLIIAVGKFIMSIAGNAKFTFDDFLKELEKRIDESKDKLSDSFEGGKCVISANNNVVNANAEIFYTENDNWQKKTISYSVPLSHFAKDESTKSKLNSLKNTPMCFDIT